MKVLVVGSGAREHALAWTLARESGVQVVCAPGNPGIAGTATCLPVDIQKPEAIAALAVAEGVDLTVIGPELPLSLGVADVFAAKGLPLFGPTKAAAALEWSKAFAKDFMARHRVPTAAFRVCTTAEAALAVLATGELGYPVVIKADGLAAGKGVVIAADRVEAENAVHEMMVDRRFGAAGDQVVLEECLVGEEASYFVVADGATYVALSSAQDHKRIFDGDRGPNTGGMGAFAPSPRITPAVEQRVLDEIVTPVLSGMAAEGTPFRGFLYVGLMLTAAGPRVIEFNARFGDPEAQVILPMLDEPLSTLLLAAATGRLTSGRARFAARKYVGVVLASKGYPDVLENGKTITGLAAAAKVPDAMVFHAGTVARDGQILSHGGRVLTVVGSGDTYEEAIAVAYRAAAAIHFDGVQFRRDIGRKALV